MQLSRMLGMHKSTISRLLTSLQYEGFVHKNPDTGKYQLGLSLVHLAGFVLDRLDLREVAQPHIRELAKLTQETINIAVLDRDMCLNIESIISPKPIQHAGRLGARYPLGCTSTGRVLLANLPSEEREVLLSVLENNQMCNKVILDQQALEKILDHVREQGYAIVHEGYQEGLSAIAAPIRDHTGNVIAAVSISGPTYRIGQSKIQNFIDALLDTANDISSNLGEGMLS